MYQVQEDLYETMQQELKDYHKLKDRIRHILMQDTNDLCWIDVYKELGGYVGVIFDPELMDKTIFLTNCAKFCEMTCVNK